MHKLIGTILHYLKHHVVQHINCPKH